MTAVPSNATEVAAAVCLVVEVATVATVATLGARRVPSDERLDRYLVGTLIAVAQMVGVPLLLGMVDLLVLPAVVVVHLALAAGAVALDRSLPRPTEVEDPGTRRQGHWTAAGLLAIGSAVAYFTVGLYYSLRSRRSFDFDTKEYHVNNLASWLQRHNIWHLPYAGPGMITATHPGNGELFGLWLALPTHRDQLVYAAPLAFAALAILAAAVVARELSGGSQRSAAVGALAAIAVLTTPVMLVEVDSLGTDFPGAAGVLTALALILVARRRPSMSVAVLAGMALGLGLGSKYTSVLPAALVAVGALALLRQRRLWWWLVPGVIFFAGPWLLRNLLTTGNPLYPESVGPLRGSETPIAILSTTILHQLLQGNGPVIRTWLKLIGRLVGPVLALIGAAVVSAASKRDRLVRLVVAAIVVGSIAGFLTTPYTGGGPSGFAFIMGSTFRYGATALLIGAGLFAGALDARIGLPAVSAVLVWNLWRVYVNHGVVRTDLVFHAGPVIVAILLGAVVAYGLFLLSAAKANAGKAAWFPSLILIRAAWASLALLGLVASFVVVHRIDRRTTQTALEKTLLYFGSRTPAVVLGEGDLRAALGPELNRPLLDVSRGGKADELPFADANQLRRLLLADRKAPPPPPTFAPALDAAIEASHATLLVLGTSSSMAFPSGWVPKSSWCLVGSSADGSVYVKLSILPTHQCPSSSSVGGQTGRPSGPAVPIGI